MPKMLEARPGVEYDCSLKTFGINKNQRVLDALALAARIHELDKRKLTGEPYVNHCVATASILISWGANEEEVIAGLLHDTVEDHPDLISLEDIESFFGERVSALVSGVTKLKTREGDRNKFETLRKVTRESLIEPGVALVKLADRLHNMMTLDGMSASKQREKALETISVYGPLAESLGLWQVKNALLDLAFRYAEPPRFENIQKQIDSDKRLSVDFIWITEEKIREVLLANRLRVVVEHQVGGYWELAEKQRRSGIRANSRPKNFVDITDVVSFRVIVENDADVGECYRAMGIIRSSFGSALVSHRHDDYLVRPSANGYAAIHDTYRLDAGCIEIAFTTRGRENFNNWGVLTVDREKLKVHPNQYDRKLVFTPKQELVFLEPGATGIDVAYKLNPLLGMRAIAIKIDGKVTGLDAVVSNTSLVEIITDQHRRSPDLGWLNCCNIETRYEIEQQQMWSEHDEEVEKGRNMLIQKVLKNRGVLDLVDLDEELVDKLLVDLGCWYGIDDLYFKIAYGLDMAMVSKKLDDLGVVPGMFTSIEVKGENRIGVSEEVAGIVAHNGGDARSKSEKVDNKERFVIRILCTISYEGKKKLEETLKQKYGDCLVV